ncbi:MAG: hypothetical protein ACKVT2_23120 [Saprospiraceae bacterium]
MKNTLFFVVAFGCAVTSTAQDPLNQLYVFASLGGGGSHGTANISLDFIASNKYFLSIGKRIQIKNSQEMPKDYFPGDGLYNLLGSDGPDQETGMLALTFGRAIPFDTGPRLILASGLGIGTVTKPGNFIKQQQAQTWLGTSSNYTYDLEETTAIGLLLNARLDFPFTRFIGLSAGSTAILSKKDPYIGLELLLHLGYLRQRLR